MPNTVRWRCRIAANNVLEVWGSTSAANVQKVTWFLEEIGQPFVARGIGYTGSDPIDEVYLKVRGGEASPILKDGELVLWEGNAVIRYLAETYAPGRFYPAALAARAEADRWMDYQLSTIRPPLHAMLRDQLDVRAVTRNAAKLAEAMEPVEAALARRPYLAGDTFTIGDIPVGINAYRWFLLDVERPKSPAIEAWVERLKARPAFAKTIVPPGNPNVALRV
jgi:glutathione S-transferase